MSSKQPSIVPRLRSGLALLLVLTNAPAPSCCAHGAAGGAGEGCGDGRKRPRSDVVVVEDSSDSDLVDL